jgi:hypothetical protein
LTLTTKKTTWPAVESQTMTGGFISSERSRPMARKRHSGSLVAAVIESLPTRVHGNTPWYERVAPEHQAELEELRAAWKSGKLKVRRNTAARIIAAHLHERGIATVGTQGVCEWLGKA